MWSIIPLMSRLSAHACGPATGKARLPTVDTLLVGTTERSGGCVNFPCRLGLNIFYIVKKVV